MRTAPRTLALSGTALVSAGALLAATPTISANADAPALGVMPVSPAVALLSSDDHYGSGYGYGHDDDDDEYHANGYHDDHDDDDDDDDHRRRGGGFGNFIADFLANNQDEVLAVTAMIPTFYLGPVAVGNSLLANAYYNGYEGSAPGGEGVAAYVLSQIGVPPSDIIQGLVLGVTSLVPRFNIGPVAVGNSLLATAFFSGYNGSATGLPGVVSYVTSQLGLQTAAPAAAVAAAKAAPAPAVAAPAVEADTAGDSDSAPAAVAVTRSAAEQGTGASGPADVVSSAVPAGSDSADAAAVAVAASPRAAVTPAAAEGSAAPETTPGAEDSGRSVSRGAVSSKSSEGARSVKARQGRSAAARAGSSDS